MDFPRKMIGFRCLWGHAQHGIAEIGFKVSLSMENKMYGFLRKMLGFRCLWGHAQHRIAEIEFKASLSMESKMYVSFGK